MMLKGNILGSGFIAKNLYEIKKILKKNNAILYAAGISNSKERSKK